MGVDVGRVDLQGVDHELTRIVWTVDFLSVDCGLCGLSKCGLCGLYKCGLCGLYKCGLHVGWELYKCGLCELVGIVDLFLSWIVVSGFIMDVYQWREIDVR